MLDNYQRDAVNQTGNVFLEAGPGAGKTRTVAAKIEQVLSDGVDLSEILALSFSNQAKSEIVRRLPFMDNQVKTIHAFGNSLLKTKYKIVGIEGGPDTLNDRKLVMLAYQLELKLPKGGYPIWIYKAWKNQEIREVVNRIVDAIDRFKSTPDSILPLHLQEAYEVYETYLKENNLIDFNDMLRYAVEEIDKNPISYKWIFLDEGHDTSMLQYELLKRIGTDHIWGVFSEHQMIYRWNGADERNQTRFKADYSPVVKSLKNNWRSNKVIVDALEKVYKDKLEPQNTEEGEVRLIQISPGYGLELVQKLIARKGTYSVLARTHRQLYQVLHSEEGQPKIKAGTIHQSKGSEADTVIVLGCGDDFLPLKRSFDLVEEKNLLYVAMSRAKTNLYLLYENFPSYMLGELGNDLEDPILLRERPQSLDLRKVSLPGGVDYGDS